VWRLFNHVTFYARHLCVRHEWIIFDSLYLMFLIRILGSLVWMTAASQCYFPLGASFGSCLPFLLRLISTLVNDTDDLGPKLNILSPEFVESPNPRPRTSHKQFLCSLIPARKLGSSIKLWQQKLIPLLMRSFFETLRYWSVMTTDKFNAVSNHVCMRSARWRWRRPKGNIKRGGERWCVRMHSFSSFVWSRNYIAGW
jgi:hypothetical protein